MVRRAGLGIAFVLGITFIASAQDVGRFELSVSEGAVFSKSSASSNGVLMLKPTNSGATLGTFRYRFNRRHGLELNIGHTMNSQIYVLPPNNFRVMAGVTEYSGAYVLNLFQTPRLEPFLFGGAGALRFTPGNTYIDGFLSPFPVTRQTALAFLYGGGADYHLWRFFSARLQYRGLIYKTPNFGQPNLATGAKGHLAEPAIGIVAKF
jgi:outer membrane immunogenic protein